MVQRAVPEVLGIIEGRTKPKAALKKTLRETVKNKLEVVAREEKEREGQQKRGDVCHRNPDREPKQKEGQNQRKNAPATREENQKVPHEKHSENVPRGKSVS